VRGGRAVKHATITTRVSLGSQSSKAVTVACNGRSQNKLIA